MSHDVNDNGVLLLDQGPIPHDSAECRKNKRFKFSIIPSIVESLRHVPRPTPPLSHDQYMGGT